MATAARVTSARLTTRSTNSSVAEPPDAQTATTRRALTTSVARKLRPVHDVINQARGLIGGWRMISPGVCTRIADPGEVRRAARDNGQHDELRQLIRVQLAHARLERRQPRRGGFHHELTLALGFDRALPAVDRVH